MASETKYMYVEIQMEKFKIAVKPSLQQKYSLKARVRNYTKTNNNSKWL